MRPVVLNDDTYIYSADGLKEYLVSLGFDIHELAELLLGDIEVDNNVYIRRDCVDDYECLYSELDNQVRQYANELEALCDKLASGKGGTKVQYAQKIMRSFTNSFEI